MAAFANVETLPNPKIYAAKITLTTSSRPQIRSESDVEDSAPMPAKPMPAKSKPTSSKGRAKGHAKATHV